jgi:hypothetical protein
MDVMELEFLEQRSPISLSRAPAHIENQYSARRGKLELPVCLEAKMRMISNLRIPSGRHAAPPP